MKERTKLYVDMAKGFSLGAFGAVLFREFGVVADIAFVVFGSACFTLAWLLTGRADRDR